LTHQAKGNEKVVCDLEDSLEAARHCRTAADALFGPIQKNLEILVETGHKLVLMQKMQDTAEANKLNEVLEHQCGDPNCPIHGKVN
jgi:hypothetical protein